MNCKFRISIIYLLIPLIIQAQEVPVWSWISGDLQINSEGYYGSKGIVSSSNYPPSSFGGVCWSDTADNFYIFGGFKKPVDDYLNAVWKFDGENWVWVSGSSLVNVAGSYGVKGLKLETNTPGSRSYVASWVDDNGCLWLYGGFGYDKDGKKGFLNDLWEFDGQYWIWIDGGNQNVKQEFTTQAVYGELGVPNAINTPGARMGSATWVDGDGNMWLFGGYAGMGNKYLNDLWRYNGKDWAWMGGSIDYGASGNYGIKNEQTLLNMPSARYHSTSWVDQDGVFWLFGGTGYDNSGVRGYLNDLWKFHDGLWTWVGGDSTINSVGVYGLQGVPMNTNKPGARAAAMGNVDSEGNFWMFGGIGMDINGEWPSSLPRGLNDLWKFDGTNWTWINGLSNYSYSFQPVLQMSYINNFPENRSLGYTWMNSSDHFYLFGGASSDVFRLSTNSYYSAGGPQNDFWKLNWTERPKLTKFSKVIDTIYAGGEMEITFTNLLKHGDELDNDGIVTAFQIAENYNGFIRIDSDTFTYSSLIDAGIKAFITDSTMAYWTSHDDASGPQVAALGVLAVDNDGATSADIIKVYMKVLSKDTVTDNLLSLLDFQGNINVYPNPNPGDFVFIEFLSENSYLQIIDLSGRIVFSEKFDRYKSVDVSRLDSGVYIAQITNKNQIIQKRFVINR